MGLVDTFFNLGVVAQTWRLLLSGLQVTILLGLVSIVLGMAGGLAMALARVYGAPWLRMAAVAYIDVFRAIPLLVLLIVIYYALPFLGIRLSPFAAAAAALSLVSCAYAAEIFRAGIEAIPRGQFEAARALGFHWWPMMRLVILPQAVRIVVPPLTGNCINVIKDTALASVVAMPDLLKQATQAQALAANPTPLILAAAIYLAILLPLVRLVAMLEARFSEAARR
ncbi:MAG: amino acid ABC transporter permease [Geminicoccaceae bacterium]